MLINFPIYVVRDYHGTFEEDGLKIITTARSRYILDFASSDEPRYDKRRLKLLTVSSKYILYPLSKRIENISQLIRSGCKNFIDSTGSLVVWKPQCFYPLVCKLVNAAWKTDAGLTAVQADGDTFILSGGAPKYVQVVQMGGVSLLYKPTDEYIKRTRIKV